MFLQIFMLVLANILMLSLEHGAPQTVSTITASHKNRAKTYNKVVKQNVINKQMMARMTLKENSCINIV